MSATIFKPVGIGRVAVNAEIGAKDVEITNVEWNFMKDGEINANPTPLEFTTVDQTGYATADKVTTDLTVTATWLPFGTNRLSPPNVRRGERVMLYQTGTTDKYYWQPLGLDDHLRKLETIIIGISATRNEDDKELRPDNMYWIELSSHSKRFAFSSSKADGEPFVYEMFFDFEKGEFTLTDDIGNFVNLVSAEHLIHMQNTDGTFVKLDKKNIRASAPDSIFAEAKKNVEVKAGKDINVKAGNNITEEAGTNVSVKAGSNATIEAGSAVTVKGGTTATMEGGQSVSVKGGQTATVEGGQMASVTGAVASVLGQTSLTLGCGPTQLILSPAGASMKAAAFTGG